MQNKKLFLFELNEFNFDFLKKYSKLYNLKFLKKLLKLEYKKLKCDSVKEMQGLDPWTQWVNIHTGKTAKNHKLFQIGESQKLKYPQIWDSLSKKKISSGIWGAMNSKNNNQLYNHIYFPDPWNFSQDIKPRYLKSFFLLPSYLLKNYVRPSKIKTIIYFFYFISFFLRPRFLYSIIKKSFFIFKFFFTNKINKYFFYPIFDWLCLVIFLELKKKHDLNFSLFFANFLASSQHRIWQDSSRKKENYFTFLILENIIKEIFLSLDKNEKLIVASGLSQKKIPNEFYYRQIDQYSFFKNIGLKNFKIEQNMTNDCMIFFKSKKDMINGFNIIKKITINKNKMFHCERKKILKNEYIFCRIIFNKKVNSKTLINIKNKTFRFFEMCVLDAIRTGEHIPVCHLFSNFKIKKIKMNHQIFSEIYSQF